MNRAPRLLFFIALIVVLAACGSPGAGNEPGDQALEATAASAPIDVPPTEVPAATPTEPAPAAPLSASDVQRITPAEAKSLMDSGDAVLYDTRSAAAYDALHAAGALSFPEGNAAARNGNRIGDLPADKSLVFY